MSYQQMVILIYKMQIREKSLFNSDSHKHSSLITLVIDKLIISSYDNLSKSFLRVSGVKLILDIKNFHQSSIFPQPDR